MFCKFCKKDSDTPCVRPFDAAIRCGIDERTVEQEIVQQQIQESRQAAARPTRPAIEVIEADRPEDDWEDNHLNVKTGFSYPTIGHEVPVRNVAQTFVFDDNVLMLLKEAQTELDKESEYFDPGKMTRKSSATLEQLWAKAKKLSSEYEIVLQPTLKKKS